MSDPLTAYQGVEIYDGSALRGDHAVLVRKGVVEGVVPLAEVPGEAVVEDLGGGILCPGFVDLQVNGGGGVMLNSDPSVETLEIMARAHAGLGATTILPTLITDTREHTQAAVAAVVEAQRRGIAGIRGLHLEGPHLSIARKGAHDPDLIRPMDAEDLAFLCAAAQELSVLKVTVAPESVTPAQIRALAAAGVRVALGHTDASFDVANVAAEAGASIVTHLFNAMSQLGNREPGLVGAAVSNGALSAGLIADGVHVHKASVAAAWRAMKGPGQMFLVSDAMATAGSEIGHFILNGRKISRDGNRLTLEDGTLAGAHLDLATALAFMTERVGVPLAEALSMATSRPAALVGLSDVGHLHKGARADMVLLTPDLSLARVWQGGTQLSS